MARTKNRGLQQSFSPSYTVRRWRLGEYIRLSKEDLKKGKDDSNSVINQRDLLNDFCMCAAVFVFWAGKCGIHGNCRFCDGISGNFCNISIADIYSDYSQLSVFVFCGHACNCICRSYTKRTYAWNNHCLCLWLWRYVCFWKCYISQCLSCYCKFRPDQLPKLRSGGTLECVNLSV